MVFSVGKPGEVYLTDPEVIANLVASFVNFELTSYDDDEGNDTFQCFFRFACMGKFLRSYRFVNIEVLL